ncbi:MAG: hypothetical protein H7A03_11130 [Pseudomonadales bacterium]|nr:hypothetical protein [Pseudomonadales bacterium]
MDQTVFSRVIEALYEGPENPNSNTITIPDTFSLGNIPELGKEAFAFITKPYLKVGASRADVVRNITLCIDNLDIVLSDTPDQDQLFRDQGRVLAEGLLDIEPVTQNLIIDFNQTEKDDVHAPDANPLVEKAIKNFLPAILHNRIGKRAISIMTPQLAAWGLNTYNIAVLPQSAPSAVALAFYDPNSLKTKGDIPSLQSFLPADKLFQVRIAPEFLVEGIIQRRMGSMEELLRSNQVTMTMNLQDGKLAIKLETTRKFGLLSLNVDCNIDLEFLLDQETNVLRAALKSVNFDYSGGLSHFLVLFEDMVDEYEKNAKALIEQRLGNLDIDLGTLLGNMDSAYPFFEAVDVSSDGMLLSGTLETGRIRSAGCVAEAFTFLGNEPNSKAKLNPTQDIAVLPTEEREVNLFSTTLGYLKYDLLNRSVKASGDYTSDDTLDVIADSGVTHFGRVGVDTFRDPNIAFKKGPVTLSSADGLFNRVFLFKNSLGYLVKFQLRPGPPEKPYLLRWVMYQPPVEPAISIDFRRNGTIQNEYYAEPFHKPGGGDYFKWVGSDRYYADLDILLTRLQAIKGGGFDIHWDLIGTVGELGPDLSAGSLSAFLGVLTETLKGKGFTIEVKVTLTDIFGRVFSASRVFQGSAPYAVPQKDVPQMKGHWDTIIPGICEDILDVIQVINVKQVEFGLKRSGKSYLENTLL